MGRYISIPISTAAYYGIRDIKPGYGSGAFRFYGVSGTFTIPTGVSEVRVTALGGGGYGGGHCCCNQGCCVTSIGGGGGGGGYAVATLPVTPGCICNVAVGAAGSSLNSAGGTSCFGLLVYACGGGFGCGNPGAGAGGTGGAGGTFAVCAGATCVVGRNGNAGCCGMAHNLTSFSCSNAPLMCGAGGASAGPIGGAGTGPFPGTSGSDVYNCKGFNGEDATEADLATKFGNTIRWPGDAILGTSRTATVISGTAPNFPPGCYCVSAFGGGVTICSCCIIANPSCCGGTGFRFYNAGYGGGGSGCRVVCGCACSSPYLGFFCYCMANNLPCCNHGCIGTPGNGFVVVEF